ncbi:neutrophil antibiotic peptide NP-1-like [Marmota flaviventris]|uniref:neutrophil antibiotic peptide NP-1-like n=1 Tax=Marmota flaviventris TaxID=93162 RepID=UPI003A88BBCF
MRTLALLAALLLLALQAQAEPLGARVEEAPDQQQPGQEDQVATISFTGDENSAQDAGVRAGAVCTCRRPRCNAGERVAGSCRLNGIFYLLCCR